MADRPAFLVAGDIDGFFALALDNLIQLLVIVGLCGGVLGFGPELLFGRVLPGAAVSVLVGNLYYARQARRLAARTGRDDVTALPYGINTVSLFAYVFLVMLPAKLAAQAAGMDADAAALIAWRAGLAACFGSGLLELVGSFFADWLRRHTPRAALLSTLAGIAVSFIALGFLFKAFGSPIVGLTTLTVVLVSYFGKVRFFGNAPGGLVAIVLGTILAWATGLAGTNPEAWATATATIGFKLPAPAFGEIAAAIGSGDLLVYLAVIVPMGIVNVVGSLQNIESAEAAGDRFETAPALVANGVGTLAAAAFGSCFPTTIYIGHPGWKAMGARTGYSVLSGLFITVICLTGTVGVLAYAIPIEAGMAIVIWIGIIIVAQAFEASPREHMPAVAVGMLPGIAAWGTLMMKQGLRVGGYGSPDGPAFGPHLEPAFAVFDVSARGAFALEQGFIFTAMILAATTTEIIDRRFRRAAVWCFSGAVMSWFGLIHAYDYTPGDTFVRLGFGAGAEWALAYAAAAAFLVAVPWIATNTDAPVP
ncbi:MAG: AGZA family xanthine/uracil permease-like MFS transporter [Hyphomicrobiaceae bacterium]|jgi:AGZA family xanthine/uracil permease-like MFS transporter